MASIELPDPEPELESDETSSVERAIADRESRRSFASRPLALTDVSQLLWAAQGITHTRDGIAMRATPSAGTTYPLTAFLEVARDGNEELAPGCYRYEPAAHRLERTLEGSVHEALTRAALGQDVVRNAPTTVVLTGAYDRTRRQYPDRGERYVHMEAGHAAENVHLLCESRELNCCPVGAFSAGDVADVLGLPDRLEALYLLPVGHRTGDR
ncbi:SagB/ThcOx family dehydrogenase [Natronolimnohabitans sp. A-GB9]|uniref:SagB/ThcOx family dehydrogenase n=1 Tax=Natronolimnohabitans sp. A-GB9 TaxID=3069757 RepID=UPI0027B78A76|nr:SagB/ThcOx family dehydrogenase [Natronolimnohabitans sp. A-GB9]MDQ2052405.1 SagB/ThcOx family dehydrogenase [Natronolimnohabitans sp. A-GB9]